MKKNLPAGHTAWRSVDFSPPNRCSIACADASKVALVHLVEHLKHRGYVLFDIQQLTPHTARFGAVEIPRREYLARLAEAIEEPVGLL